MIDSASTGAAICKLRKAYGISARNVAKAVGHSSMSMSFYENGRRKITAATAKAIITAIYKLAKVKISPRFNLEEFYDQ